MAAYTAGSAWNALREDLRAVAYRPSGLQTTKTGNTEIVPFHLNVVYTVYCFVSRHRKNAVNYHLVTVEVEPPFVCKTVDCIYALNRMKERVSF